MGYIYAADRYCAACGAAIRDRLAAEGKAPADPRDAASYDSGAFPKEACHAGDEAGLDYVAHCGSGFDCVNAIAVPGGDRVGGWLGNRLTAEGISGLLAAVAAEPDNRLIQLHARLYRDELTDYLYDFGRKSRDIEAHSVD